MSKARRCNWCGKKIGKDEARVKLPVVYDAPAITYHTDCYCRIYSNKVLRALVNDDPEFSGLPTLGGALAQVLRALDPANDD